MQVGELKRKPKRTKMLEASDHLIVLGRAGYRGKGVTVIRSLQRQLMPDTVGPEEHKRTSLQGIAYKAKTDKAHRFGNLSGELNEDLLKEAWRRLNKQAAGGVDRVTARDYEQELDANIQGLVERLKAKRYHARLIRRHYIPKSDGRQRPLGIPVVEDKLLQAAAAMLLQAMNKTSCRSALGTALGWEPKRRSGP